MIKKASFCRPQDPLCSPRSRSHMGLMPPDRTPQHNHYTFVMNSHTLYHFVSIYRLFSLQVFWSFVIFLSQQFLSVVHILLILPVSLLFFSFVFSVSDLRVFNEGGQHGSLLDMNMSSFDIYKKIKR